MTVSDFWVALFALFVPGAADAFLLHPQHLCAHAATIGRSKLVRYQTDFLLHPQHLRAYAAMDTIGRSKLVLSQTDLAEPSDSNFGRRDYWNSVYETQDEFSWYSTWQELEPFVTELIPYQEHHVLIPGMENDGAIVDMYDSGYRNLTAFDYAPAGVECARKLLTGRRIRDGTDNDTVEGVTLLVADARELPFEDSQFDAVLDKGTLDAIFLSGGRVKKLGNKHLTMAVSELGRVVVENGVVISISAACVDAVQDAFQSQSSDWVQIRDGTLYITDDGFASNNVDGTLLAWKRTSTNK